jgi:hypothetical protein
MMAPVRVRTVPLLVVAWLACPASGLAQDAAQSEAREPAPEMEAAELSAPTDDGSDDDADDAEDAAAETEQPAAPRAPWRWPGTLIGELTARVHFPPEGDFDRALAALGYGSSPVVPQITAGMSFPIGVEWLWLGGRVGLRGRTWDHRYRDDASLVGVDLVAVLRARIAIGSFFELGASVAGGLGWMGVWMNGTMIDQLVPRFDVAAEIMFAIGRHFAFGPRGGWDYFQWTGLNAYGHGTDAGGPWVGLALEARE